MGTESGNDRREDVDTTQMRARKKRGILCNYCNHTTLESWCVVARAGNEP